MIVGVACTIGAMVVALFVFSKLGFGNSESSYEETIARQKEILLDDAKSKADKKKLKADKKKKGTYFITIKMQFQVYKDNLICPIF